MSQIVADLARLNEAFAVAERATDSRFFETHLADGLQFRRASGAVVDKRRFLDDLGAPGSTSERLEARDVEVFAYGPDLAVCSLLVDFKGTRGGQPGEAVVRNTRVFVRSDGLWKCALWVNTNDGPGSHPVRTEGRKR